MPFRSLNTVPGPAVSVDEFGTTVKLVVAAGEGPPRLLATAVIVCGPVVRVMPGQDQAPLVVAVVVHNVVPFSPTVTLELGVAVPLMVGVVVVVVPLTGPKIAIVAGPTTVKDVVTTGELPVKLLATAVSVCGPALNGVGLEQLQVPADEAIVVHIVVLSSPTVTLAPGVAVPLIGGLAFVCVPLAGLTKPIVGAMPHKPPGVV